MLLAKNNYNRNALLGKTVLLTGGGGGIGFEAARAFSYMGAKVIIAEIDAGKGTSVQNRVNAEFNNRNVDFFQVDLAAEAEIDGSGILAYAIAPGFVKTDTAIKAVETVAASMKISTDEFYESLDGLITDAEIAGTGYAVSVVNAQQYHGKLILSHQVLVDGGLIDDDVSKTSDPQRTMDVDYERLSSLFTKIADVFFDQYQGWQKKKLFQKQFILMDFKKQMGTPAEVVKQQLETLQEQAQHGQWKCFWENKGLFIKLQNLYRHQREVLQGYEKNKAQLASDTALLDSWIVILQDIIDMLL